ncbi:DHH family phosphoesterase [Salinispira pacifica]
MDRLPVPPDLLEYFRPKGTYIIISHADPDGDCIGSSLALASVLRRTGNQALLLNPGPFDREEIKPFAGQFLEHLPEEVRGQDPAPRVVVLDASTLDRIGDIRDEISGLTVAAIDHHSSGDPFGDVRYVDPSSPSTSYLIQRLVEALGLSLEREEADQLMFALATDTGYFRFLDESAGDVLCGAGRLLDAGASPSRTYYQMFGGRSLESRRLLAILLRRTRAYFGGRLLISWQTRRDAARFGEENRDSMSFYQLLMTTRDCQIIVFLRDVDGKSCTGSLRSLEDIDVGRVAQEYGGGGHARAAGFLARKPLSRVRKELVSLFGGMLTDKT